MCSTSICGVRSKSSCCHFGSPLLFLIFLHFAVQIKWVMRFIFAVWYPSGFQDWFSYACPKFVAASMPDLDSSLAFHKGSPWPWSQRDMFRRLDNTRHKLNIAIEELMFAGDMSVGQLCQHGIWESAVKIMYWLIHARDKSISTIIQSQQCTIVHRDTSTQWKTHKTIKKRYSTRYYSTDLNTTRSSAINQWSK